MVFLSTCWSGEAHLWAYLAPPESSKHSFLWLSVWWRRAAMWNTAQHSQQWKESWLQGCESHSFPVFSPLPGNSGIASKPHLEVMFCVTCHCSFLFESTRLYTVMLCLCWETHYCFLAVFVVENYYTRKIQGITTMPIEQMEAYIYLQVSTMFALICKFGCMPWS